MTNIKTLWTNQKTEETVTLENIYDKAAKFQRRVYWGNAVEYAAAILVVAIFGWYIWALPGWMAKFGSALVIVAVCYGMRQLARRSRASKLPDSSAVGLVDFHRQALVRRRDALSSAWRWYILPMVPGLVMIYFGRWYQIHVPGRPLPLDHTIIVLAGIIVALGLGIVALIQALASARIQRRIDELDRLKQ